MKSIDTMTLAWKIFRAHGFVKKFNYALKLAWVIVKKSKIFQNKDKLTIKGFIKETMFIKTIGSKIRGGFEFIDNSYNLNLFAYEARTI